MSSVCITVERGFGDIIDKWKFLDFRSAMKIFEMPVGEFYTKAASQHFRLCIVEMHSRKLRHDDTSAKNVTQYVAYALASQH